MGHQPEDVHPGPGRNRPQHHQHEQDADHVELDQEAAQRQQRGRPEPADGEGDGSESPDRRGPHDEADHAEEHLAQVVDGGDHGPAPLAHGREGEGGQHRDQKHRQDLRLGEGAHEGGRDDVQQSVGDALVLGLGGVAGGRVGVDGLRIDVHPGARAPQVHRRQGEGEGDGGDDLEIDDRLQRHPAGAAHVVHARHPVHHGAEDHRGDDHPDQGDEGVAQGLHLGPQVRVQPAQQGAQRHGRQHLEPELPDEPHQHGFAITGAVPSRRPPISPPDLHPNPAGPASLLV